MIDEAVTDASGASTIDANRPTAANDAHVLVVDDDARIRDLIKRFLQKAGYRSSAAKDAAKARALMEALSFDLLIVDVMMPGEDGFSFTKWIDGETPVLLLTARGDAESRILGLESGADDYLPKPFQPRELILRIDAILRRTKRDAPKAAAAAAKLVQLGEDAQFDAARGEFFRDGEEIRLTTAEIALLRLLAKRPNEPVSRAELLTEIAGGDDTVGEMDADRAVQERAVDVQITRLRKKIEIEPKSPRFVKTVRGSGYMLTP